MRERIVSAALDAGVSRETIPYLERAYAVAMGAREGRRTPPMSDRNPSFLHPGRTVLILVDDLRETSGKVLAVAALAESRDLDLSASTAEAEHTLVGGSAREDEGTSVADRATGPSASERAEAFEWWKALPRPSWGVSNRGQGPSPDDTDAGFLETVVTAPGPVQRVALAEALDQLRHAHQWPSDDERRRAAELATDVLLPVAERVSPVLARRYAWWVRRVAPALNG